MKKYFQLVKKNINYTKFTIDNFMYLYVNSDAILSNLTFTNLEDNTENVLIGI